jgi:hypothetical protein
MNITPDSFQQFTTYLKANDPELFNVFANGGLSIRPDEQGVYQLLILTASHLYTGEQYKKLEKYWEDFKSGRLLSDPL